MGILSDFEERLERAVEGLFARAFKSGVQPVELGKRLVRTVEVGRTVGVSRVYVPNVYTYELSPDDRKRFAEYEHALTAELAQLAVQTARDHDWAMLGPARVEFTTAPDLVEGRFRLTGRVEAAKHYQFDQPPPAAAAAQPAGPLTAIVQGEARPPKLRAPASLTLLNGSGTGRVFPLSSAELKVGRSEQSDIALADPGVSRSHARVVREGDDFIVEDLGSTNGPMVNGRPVRRRRLADGDIIKLGNSTLQFRREA